MHTTPVTIDDAHAGQRLDNFLITRLKGVPSTRIYRAIRKGEVRVNKRRVGADYRLVVGDLVRIPPVQMAAPKKPATVDEKLLISLEMRILYEEADLLVIDKPAGLPVHGGSGIQGGLIEALRIMRPKVRLLELVHRLDRETSGCLMVAKKRSTLVALHTLLTQRKVIKQYLLLVKGQWQGGECRVEVPLKKNRLQSGERMVKVEKEGKSAVTVFRPLKIFEQASLIEAKPLTGRTHQIRVHAAHLGYPIAGDEKYGDKVFNREMRNYGLRRLFLHSAGILCQWEDKRLGVCAILDSELMKCLTQLNAT
ncbi:RluA family pseudouridine synthase [Coxiella burnetii]|uniref:Pseudouridine synthase n=1 Tax=Coxiella burnetii (strain Dugway 5J108-111) TaxID=434922 RepID=A9KEA7_COXBN|nr:RluA family pseudouridine synthase [Coxiella burnetii]ABS78517.1 ribosomal large subunit pseudouridine synthase C [Coxiella burnetii Dugway 5J108-111]ACJ20550.1 ribosomal large subunit pseudouridine synthase C [Coxiella burnetii CbuK_Q154]ATN86172.1 23S rRNA pseudouridylate synthase [Coxiella burnetii str. Schperling]EDQ95142.1 23S rRNA pseudouridine(955/2504/2580) synthase [Coxiella burnetii 'MSU Goat Q177']EDR35404.1 ribosomal large subunit pseudouridine synthase C [Coxiella burnetii Q321